MRKVAFTHSRTRKATVLAMRHLVLMVLCHKAHRAVTKEINQNEPFFLLQG